MTTSISSEAVKVIRNMYKKLKLTNLIEEPTRMTTFIKTKFNKLDDHTIIK